MPPYTGPGSEYDTAASRGIYRRQKARSKKKDYVPSIVRGMSPSDYRSAKARAHQKRAGKQTEAPEVIFYDPKYATKASKGISERQRLEQIEKANSAIDQQRRLLAKQIGDIAREDARINTQLKEYEKFGSTPRPKGYEGLNSEEFRKRLVKEKLEREKTKSKLSNKPYGEIKQNKNTYVSDIADYGFFTASEKHLRKITDKQEVGKPGKQTVAQAFLASPTGILTFYASMGALGEQLLKTNQQFNDKGIVDISKGIYNTTWDFVRTANAKTTLKKAYELTVNTGKVGTAVFYSIGDSLKNKPISTTSELLAPFGVSKIVSKTKDVVGMIKSPYKVTQVMEGAELHKGGGFSQYIAEFKHESFIRGGKTVGVQRASSFRISNPVSWSDTILGKKPGSIKKFYPMAENFLIRDVPSQYINPIDELAQAGTTQTVMSSTPDSSWVIQSMKKSKGKYTVIPGGGKQLESLQGRGGIGGGELSQFYSTETVRPIKIGNNIYYPEGKPQLYLYYTGMGQKGSYADLFSGQADFKLLKPQPGVIFQKEYINPVKASSLKHSYPILTQEMAGITKPGIFTPSGSSLTGWRTEAEVTKSFLTDTQMSKITTDLYIPGKGLLKGFYGRNIRKYSNKAYVGKLEKNILFFEERITTVKGLIVANPGEASLGLAAIKRDIKNIEIINKALGRETNIQSINEPFIKSVENSKLLNINKLSYEDQALEQFFNKNSLTTKLSSSSTKPVLSGSKVFYDVGKLNIISGLSNSDSSFKYNVFLSSTSGSSSIDHSKVFSSLSSVSLMPGHSAGKVNSISNISGGSGRSGISNISSSDGSGRSGISSSNTGKVNSISNISSSDGSSFSGFSSSNNKNWLIPPPSISPEFGQSSKKKKKKKFNLFVGGEGKFIYEKYKGLTFTDLIKKGKSRLKETAAASIRIKTSDGRNLQQRELKSISRQLGKGFTVSQIDNKIIQENKYRISSRGEKRHIPLRSKQLKTIRGHNKALSLVRQGKGLRSIRKGLI